jgi:hypothetical protein
MPRASCNFNLLDVLDGATTVPNNFKKKHLPEVQESRGKAENAPS